MNESRRLSLGLVSLLGAIMTGMTFLYPQTSSFWTISQLFLLTGCVLFLGMTFFVSDARRFKQFAIPGAIITLGELFAVYSRFHFLLDQNGMRMESLMTGNQPFEVLVAVVGILQFLLLAWTVIDISMDVPFCEITYIGLLICCGISLITDLLLLFAGFRLGNEALKYYLIMSLSDLLSFGSVVVFYCAYTTEQLLMRRYYRTIAMEKRRAEKQKIVAESQELTK